MKTADYRDLFLKADNFRNNAQIDEAITAYLDIVQRAQAEGDEESMAEALHMAGVAAREAIIEKGSYFQQATEFYHQAEEIFKKKNDLASLGAVHRDLALAYDLVGDYQEAFLHFQKSVEYLEKSDDLAQLAITYDKIGLHFCLQKQYDAALKHIEKALHLFRQAPTHGFFRATTLFDKARVLFMKGEVDQALDLALESRGWFVADHGEETYDRRKAQLAGMLAVIYANHGNEQEARKYADEYRRLTRNFHPLALKLVQASIDALTK